MAQTIAPGGSMHHIDIPPVWTLGAWLLAGALSWALPAPGWAGVEGLRWLGLLWIGIAVLMVLWAGLVFLRHKTPIEPGRTPRALVTTGPFRLSRNPIYLAMVVSTLGAVLWLGSAVALLVPLALWRVLDRRFASPEEDLLRATFGAEADAYIAKRRRWV
ncbi:MAG: isoprenylcysteine carboxylmethyltransferase family protein [Pseudomonadota bacterium]